MNWLIYLAVISLLTYLFFTWLKDKNQLPPGPSLIESVKIMVGFILRNDVFLIGEKLAQKYGEICNVRFFGSNMVFLNSSRLMRKVLTSSGYRNITNDRPPSFLRDYIFEGGQDIGFNDFNERLLKLRRVTHSVIRIYGEGVHDFEEMVNPELEILKAKLSKADGDETFDLNDALSESLLTNERVSENEVKKVRSLIEDFDEYVNIVGGVDKNFVLSTFPWLQFIPGRNRDIVQKLRHHQQRLLQYFLEPEKVKMFIPVFQKWTGNGSVIGTMYLEKEKDPGLTQTMIEGVVMDMLAAGFLTTHGALTGIFLLMLKYPYVQRRIKDELNEKLGTQQPCLHDRKKLPYTNAAILECLRYIRHIPLGLPHLARQSFEVDGYTIPAKSMIVTNFYHTCRDPTKWEKADEFNPERFLDSEGELVPADHPLRQQFIPFGVGRRNCIGESFAKSRIFLYVTNLLQKFEFQRGENELVSEDSSTWIRCAALYPQYLNCKVVSRA